MNLANHFMLYILASLDHQPISKYCNLLPMGLMMNSDIQRFLNVLIRGRLSTVRMRQVQSAGDVEEDYKKLSKT